MLLGNSRPRLDSRSARPDGRKCCIQGAYGLTDAGIGVVAPGKHFELDFVGRNVLNRHYTTNVNSNGSIGYDGMGEPRWVGVELHAKL